MTWEPLFSEVALGYVLGGLLGLHSRSMLRELDFEEPGPLVCARTGFGSGPEDIHGLIGLTPDEPGLGQFLYVDLAFIFAWLEWEVEPEKGELIPRQYGSKELSNQPEPVPLG